MGSAKGDSDPNDSPNRQTNEGEEGEGEGEGGGEGEAKEGGGEEEDPSRPEGVVQFVVTELANLESQLSDPVMIRNVPW